MQQEDSKVAIFNQCHGNLLNKDQIGTVNETTHGNCKIITNNIRIGPKLASENLCKFERIPDRDESQGTS